MRGHTALSMNKTLKKEKKHFKEWVKILSNLLKLAKTYENRETNALILEKYVRENVKSITKNYVMNY